MTWFLDALDTLYKLDDLKANWGGEGDDPITDAAISNAIRLLYRLYRRGVRRPYIYPTRDGNVQLEWDGGDQYLEVTCSDGYHYFLSRLGEEESGPTTTPVDTVINCLETFA
jgi:hypothetical protein